MKYYLEDIREVFKRTESSENGLSQSEAERRLEKYGKNKLAQAKQKSLVRRFFEQLADPMIIILIVAAVISAVTTSLRGQGLRLAVLPYGHRDNPRRCAHKRRARRLAGEQGGKGYRGASGDERGDLQGHTRGQNS